MVDEPREPYFKAIPFVERRGEALTFAEQVALSDLVFRGFTVSRNKARPKRSHSGSPGVPDFTAWEGARKVFVEVKRGDAIFTPAQVEMVHYNVQRDDPRFQYMLAIVCPVPHKRQAWTTLYFRLDRLGP